MANVICKACEVIPPLVDGRPGHGAAVVYHRTAELWYPTDPAQIEQLYNFGETPIEVDGRYILAHDADGVLVVDNGGNLVLVPE